MGFTAIKERAHALFDEAGFIGHIASEDDYAQALALMDELVEDYEASRPLIEILARSIENWENESGEFAAFKRARGEAERRRCAALADGAAWSGRGRPAGDRQQVAGVQDS